MSSSGTGGTATQQDPGSRPGSPDLRHDPLAFIQGTVRCINVRGAQPTAQHVLTACDTHRKIAVTAVVVVEEAAFLCAVQRIIGRVNVQDDLLLT